MVNLRRFYRLWNKRIWNIRKRINYSLTFSYWDLALTKKNYSGKSWEKRETTSKDWKLTWSIYL